jgi:glyoxylase-like metal-dependent hydrolase (beta-lactamase superfamily II)
MSLVGEGVHRFGTRFVNWYVVEEGDRLTLVDAGLPAYWKQLDPALESLGRTREDVEAVVLTHSHSDHTGFAENLRESNGTRVLIHDSDAELARSGRPTRPERSPLPYLRRPAALRFVAHLAGVLIAGDELCNGNPFTGRPGVQIMPRCTNMSSEQALDSLSRIEGLDASTLLFGHGNPWNGSPAEAAALAREAGPS